jgi:hypothetical protein
MTVEQTDVVDIIGLDGNTGEVVLTISDHLDWNESVEHQTTLQNKINKYLAFVESGEIFLRYPKAKGRLIAFNIVFKYTPDADGQEFLSKARRVIESAGFTLRSEVM